MRCKITRDDILKMPAYEAERRELRRRAVEMKRFRRVEVGPVATFYFENYETMWHQVHEMLWIEKGGEAQIADELEAYNPLIPQGRELIATVMFEIDDPQHRKAFLSKLGGVEETAFLEFATHKVLGKPEEDVDRTNAEGKASAVQFIHFSMTEGEAAAFKREDERIVIGFSHPQYAHMTVMAEEVRAALARDLT